MSSWLLRFLTMVSKSLQKNPQKTDPQETGAQKGDAQKADAQKSDAETTDAQKTDAQKTDAQKTDAQKTDAQKTDAQKTDAQKTDTQKTNTQTNTQKTDFQTTDTRTVDTQATNTQKIGAQVTDSEKTDIQESDTKSAQVQLLEVQTLDMQIAADAERGDVQIIDLHMTDAHMAHVQIADTQKPVAQKPDSDADAQKADTQKADPQKTDAQKIDPKKTDPQKTDPLKADPQKTDPQKTDPQKADPQKTDPQISDLQLRIQKAIRGLVLAITSVEDQRSYSPAEIYAYWALSVCCALPYLDSASITELAPEFGYEAFRDADRGPDAKDSTTRLLQWAHLMAIEKIHKTFPRHPGLYTQTEMNKVKGAQMDYYNLALDRTDLRTVFNEDAGHTNEDFGSAIIREELWNKIALLAIDLFGRGSLADQVSQRMAAREADKLGKIPPWGIRCLDHAIHVELAAMRAKLGSPMSNTREIIQEAYENISYFRRSDFSLLRCSSGTGSPSWASDLLGLDSIIICSSLLSVILQDFPEGKRSPFFNVHLTN